MTAGRRGFTTALLSVATVSFLARRARARHFQEVGLQLYTVRTLLERDFEGTLARVAALGYREVEFAGFYGPSIRETLAMLKRCSLAAPSGHVGFAALDGDLPNALRAAKELGQSFVICPSVDERLRKNLDDWKRLSQRFNEIGEQCQKVGLSFAYHNHDFEFRPVGGQIPYDVMLAETDAGLVKMEMDLYWAVKARADPVAYFERHPGRFKLLHLKDMGRDGSIADVGKGTIDFKRILAHAAPAGVIHCFVEHDEPSDPMQSIETSLRYVQQLDV